MNKDSWYRYAYTINEKDNELVKSAKIYYDSSKENGGISISTWAALFKKCGCRYNPDCFATIEESIPEYKEFFDMVFDHKPMEELYSLIEKSIKSEHQSRWKSGMVELYNIVWNTEEE